MRIAVIYMCESTKEAITKIVESQQEAINYLEHQDYMEHTSLVDFELKKGHSRNIQPISRW